MLLKELSYYKTGGTCDRLVEPSSIKELSSAMVDIDKQRIQYFLLGAGSNSLIMDDHWPGAVICLRRMTKISFNGTHVNAEAGIDNSDFSQACYQASLDGASWMYYMPGQLGGTIRMNARCYGGEIGRIVESVTALTNTGKIKQYEGKQVFGGYKNTIFMTNGEIVVSARFKLKHGDAAAINQDMKFCQFDREANHQFSYPSCGCVFKNNYEAGIPSGLLLQEADVKTLSTDLVEIGPYHANFVFNKGATAYQILETTLKMRECVFAKFGVWLDYEMEVLGAIPDELSLCYHESRPQQFKYEMLEPLRARFREKT